MTKADMILINACVLTMDPDCPRASAVAFAKGRIVAVGTNEEIAQRTGPATVA